MGRKNKDSQIGTPSTDKLMAREDSLRDESNDEKKGPNRSEIDTANYKNGKPLRHDKTFKGPIENRSCRDILCLVLFILVWIAMIIVASFALTTGNPEKLIVPTDSEGNLCGTNSSNRDLRDKPYLYFFDITQCARDVASGLASFNNMRCSTPQVCVKECPSHYGYQELQLPEDMVCRYDYNATRYNTTECAPFVIPSKPVLGRCMPLLTLEVQSQLGNLTNATTEGLKAVITMLGQTQFVQEMFADVITCWQYILGGGGLAIVFSYVYIFLLQVLTGPMVWTSIILTPLALLATSGCFIYSWLLRSGKTDFDPLNLQTQLAEYTFQTTTYLVFGCIAGGVLLIYLLLLLIFWSRIRIAIQVLREASKAIGQMKLILFFPYLFCLLELALWAYYVVIGVYIGTSSEPVWSSNFTEYFEVAGQRVGITSNHTFINYEAQWSILQVQVFHLFGTLWAAALISAFIQCSIAGAIASYYWTYDKKQVTSFPIVQSVWRTMRYHLGSLCFGSLILAIVQTIRAMLLYIQERAAKETNYIARALVKVLSCFFWLLEKFIKFLNKNAYIEIAVYGYGFCKAARRAFSLLARNCLRVIAVNGVTRFVVFVGKLGVTMSTAFATWAVLEYYPGAPTLHFSLMPVMVVAIISYFIATTSLSVYDMAVDTIFLCFCEDCERNDGSAEKPYYMSKSLQRILHKQNTEPTKV